MSNTEETMSEAEKQLEMLVEELIKGEHKDNEAEASKEQIRDSKDIICKVCKEKVHLVCTETYPNGIKKWKDEEGRIANGKICPECNKNRAKNTMRKTRANRKS